MLIDLHTHTWPGSYDSVLSPDELIERSKKAGLDAICLSEHDSLWDPAAAEALSRKHNFLVIPAVEVSTDDGHILTYGIDRYVFGMHRSEVLAQHVDRADGVMVAAHPYRRQMPWFVRSETEYEQALERAERNPAYEYVAAMETLNGRGSAKENAFSQRLAGRMGMPGTAGTDSHSVSDIGRVATYFERDVRDLRDLIRELKAGRFYPVDLRAGVAVR
jgi:predicted metal-dependent phosphoesterase TrpH